MVKILLRNRVWFRGACLACWAFAGACGDEDRPDAASDSKPEMGQRSAESPDPLAEAPEDWSALVAWAGTELSKIPPAVALPDPPPPTAPAYPITRLDEILSQASVDCTWQPPSAGPEALFSAGPLSQAIGQASSGGQANPKQMSIRGFRVARQDVGSIVLDIKISFGAHFDLIWSRAGRIRVPIPDNERSWTLNIETDGFAEWIGPLQRIAIQPDGSGPGTIEVRSIRLLRPVNSFPDAAGVRRVGIDRETRNALYMHVPAEVKYPLITLPNRAGLQVGLAQVSAGPTRDAPAPTADAAGGTLFEFWVDSGGQRTNVLRRRVQTGQAWEDVSVDLAEWSGQKVALGLTTTIEPADGAPASAVACWGNPVVYEAVENAPCVIVYLIDALAAGHIDLYGYPRPTMPRLAQLADRGPWFANAYSNSPRTVESVADLMLSMPTGRHGVYHISAAAPTELMTLPEALRASGFATASFCTNVNAGPRQNMDQGFDHFIDRIGYWWTGEADRTVPIAEVLNWLAVHRDRPTFLYIHTAEPHAPYIPLEEYADRFDPGYTGAIDGTYDKQTGFQQTKSVRDLQHVIAMYDEEVAYADARLGHFLDALAQAGHLERTNIFVTSDHGEAFREHGTWEHGRHLHAEQTRIPLVVAGPAVTARGRQDLPVQLYDLMPTILGMYELPPWRAYAGHNLLSILTDAPGSNAALEQRAIFASNHTYRNAGLIEHAVVADGRWKLMYRYHGSRSQTGRPLGRFLLFDLQADPGEYTDVIDANQSLARKLIGKLVAWQRQQAPYDVGPGRQHLQLDAKQLEELRNLGYIN
ncbi:MAG: sulfatase [bacterium]|nr:sulfatase [bacterium]